MGNQIGDAQEVHFKGPHVKITSFSYQAFDQQVNITYPAHRTVPTRSRLHFCSCLWHNPSVALVYASHVDH